MLNPNNHNLQENISKHHELTQHSLFNTHIQQLFIIRIQKLFIIHPWIQSRLLRMMHAPDLNSQMQCGTYRIQYQRNSPKRAYTTPHLGNHVVFDEATQSCIVTPPPQVINLGPQGVPYQVTHPLVQSTYYHSLYYFPCVGN